MTLTWGGKGKVNGRLSWPHWLICAGDTLIRQGPLTRAAITFESSQALAAAEHVLKGRWGVVWQFIIQQHFKSPLAMYDLMRELTIILDRTAGLVETRDRETGLSTKKKPQHNAIEINMLTRIIDIIVARLELSKTRVDNP